MQNLFNNKRWQIKYSKFVKPFNLGNFPFVVHNRSIYDIPTLSKLSKEDALFLDNNSEGLLKKLFLRGYLTIGILRSN